MAEDDTADEEESPDLPFPLESVSDHYKGELAAKHGLDPDQISVDESYEEAMKKFWEDPVSSYEEAIERHEQMIEKHQEWIQSHKVSIAHLEGQLKAEKIKAGEAGQST